MQVNAKENAITIRGDIKAKAAAGITASSNGSKDRLNRPAPKTVPAVVRPKKLSLHEQMLQDALLADAAPNATQPVKAASLLDRDIAASQREATQNVNLSNIVRQKPQTSAADKDLFELDSVFQTSNRITELD